MTFTGNTRNNQDILNYLHQKFIVEKVPQCKVKDMGLKCLYAPITKDHIGCAVGCLISEEDQKVFDSSHLSEIQNIYDVYRERYEKYFDADQLKFLEDIQKWHDGTHKWIEENKSIELSVIALRYNLEYPQIKDDKQCSYSAEKKAKES